MALALVLGEHKTPPEQLRVSAVLTLDEVDGKPTVTTSALTVAGRVPGVDAAGFEELVDAAAALCPVSRLFAGATISVTATLEAS